MIGVSLFKLEKNKIKL